MTRSAVLKKVKDAYPLIFEGLSKPKLKLVENAIVYASRMSGSDDLVSPEEHKALIRRLIGGSGITPAASLKAYRYRQDLTQAQLAKMTGIPQGNISAMESGRRPIGLAMAKKLAKALGCDYRRLV